MYSCTYAHAHITHAHTTHAHIIHVHTTHAHTTHAPNVPPSHSGLQEIHFCGFSSIHIRTSCEPQQRHENKEKQLHTAGCGEEDDVIP